MPHLVVYSPRMSRVVRAACAARLTAAFAEATGQDPDDLCIHFEEHSYDHVAVGGRLLTDAFPELAERERARQPQEDRREP